MQTTGVIAVLAIICGVAAPFASLSAADPAQPTAPLLKFDKPVTIVCLGDSVTGVYYHTGGVGAYPEMLGVAIQKLYPEAKITIVNAGISGQATDAGLARLDKDVLSKKPDLVTVSFGLNDMTRIPLETYKKNLIEITKRCQAANAKVVLCTPQAIIDTPGRERTKLVAYVEALKEAAKEAGAAVCNQLEAGEAFRNKDAWNWRLTLSDQFHPNMDGHKFMAQELCKVVTGKEVSLADVGPLSPAFAKTVKKLKEGKPVRVLAMPPYDTLIAPALKKFDPKAQVEVTTWQSAGKTLDELQKEANATVRKMRPDLVVLAIPRETTPTADEAFVNAYIWIMNWSLAFGYLEWDCFVVHPSVTDPEKTDPRDNLTRKLIGAQHLHFVDRKKDDKAPAAEIFNRWVEAAAAEAAKAK